MPSTNPFWTTSYLQSYPPRHLDMPLWSIPWAAWTSGIGRNTSTEMPSSPIPMLPRSFSIAIQRRRMLLTKILSRGQLLAWTKSPQMAAIQIGGHHLPSQDHRRARHRHHRQELISPPPLPSPRGQISRTILVQGRW